MLDEMTLRFENGEVRTKAEQVLYGEALDRMIAARFEIPEATLLKRRKLSVRVVDLDGASSVMEEGKK